MRGAMNSIRRLVLLGVIATSLTGCSLFQDGPEEVVRKAGAALRDRNRAEFYDLVDLPRLEGQIIGQLGESSPDPYGTLRVMTGRSNGEFLGSLLAPTFASAADTSRNGWVTATLLGRKLVQADVSVRGMGQAQISDRTAFVPVFLQSGRGEPLPRPVSIQLEKQDSRWRIVGIHDFSEVVLRMQREAARSSGKLYLENDRETWLPGVSCWIFMGTKVLPPSQPAGSSSPPQEGVPYCTTTN